MNFSRQALLGIGMIIGGIVMLSAMVQQLGSSDDQARTPAIVNKSATDNMSSMPLTLDIETEKRILAQKQKERALRVAEQEKQAKLFLEEQTSAESQALAKARTENQQYTTNTNNNSTTTANAAANSDRPKTGPNALTYPELQPRPNNTVTPPATTTKKPDNEAQKTQQQAAEKQAEAKKQEDTKKKAEAKKQEDTKKKAEAKKQEDAKKKAEAKKQENTKKQAEAKKQENTAKKKADVKAAAEQKKKTEDKAASKDDKKSPPKSAVDYTIESGDGLLKLARKYNVSVAALAQANKMDPSATLQIGQVLTVPSRKQIERLERDAAVAEKARAEKREEKRKREEALAKKSVDARQDAQKKLSAARKEVKETDAKGSFGVQVALATNQAAADELAKKFKSAGYQVKTSKTSRGVRVVVGPERGKLAALALKDKVNSDPDVNITSAWVLYW